MVIQNTGAFLGKTFFITGASRGIGKAIALKVAKDGANVVIAAKTTEQHPKLEGTIFSAAEEIEKAGGKCLPLKCDLRDEDAVKDAFNQASRKFGKLDVLVNNASAISLTGTEETTMKKYDLMHQINARGTFMASKYAIPLLKQSSNPHILNLSPPLSMDPVWFSPCVAYTMAKYGMSMCVLGMSEELKPYGIAVNALWPRTAIWTAAMAMLSGGVEEAAKGCRKTDIIADSAYAVLSKDSKKFTGNFLIDDDFLKSEGVTDLDSYAVAPGNELHIDFFLPGGELFGSNAKEATSATSPSSGSDSQNPVDKLFSDFTSVVDDKIKSEINSTIAFNISGAHYLLDLHSSRPFKFEKLSEAPKADVTLITDEDTLLKLSKGTVKSTNAFMTGKLKIKGNISVAMKAEKIFKAIAKKQAAK